MGLRELLAADAAAFVNTEDFGETVTYFDGGIGEGREISALVFREEPGAEQGFGRIHKAIVSVRNSAELGVSSPQVDSDEISVVLREGLEPVRCRVARIVEGDPALWTLEVVA